MPDETQLLQTPGFNPYATAPEQAIPQSVFDDPELKELARRVRMSPEEIARERIAQHLGVGKKGVGGTLQKILGLVEAAGSGFVGQKSIPDKLRARAYEEYKTVTPQLERQLEAGIRNKAAAEKEFTARYGILQKAKSVAAELAQKNPLIAAQVEKLEEEASLLATKGATEEVKARGYAAVAKLNELRSRNLENFGRQELSPQDASALFGLNQTMADMSDPAKQQKFLQEKTWQQLQPALFKAMLAPGKGGGEGKTTITTREVPQYSIGPDNNKYFSHMLLAQNQTTTSPRGGGAQTNPLVGSLAEMLGQRAGIPGGKILEWAGKAPTAEEPVSPSPASKKVAVTLAPGTPPEARAFREMLRSPIQTPQSLSANPIGLGTAKSNDAALTLQTAISRSDAIVKNVTDALMEEPQTSRFGKWLGIGPGSNFQRKARELKNIQSIPELTGDSRMLLNKWEEVRRLSGAAVTPQEQELMTRIMTSADDRSRAAWVKAMIFKLGLEHTRALRESRTLDSAQWKKMGIGDDALAKVDAYIQKQYERFERANSGKKRMTPEELKAFKETLTLEEAIPEYKAYKAKLGSAPLSERDALLERYNIKRKK